MPRQDDLLERMRASKNGWGANDLGRLYIGFGFVRREGRRHTIYKHPLYPFLYATVARHTKLAVGYIQDAVELIEKLKELESKNDNH
jgi:hypothetical protein